MPEVPALPSARALADRVDRIFEPDGALAAEFRPFEPRAGQRALARAIASIFEAGGTLVAEAGTGIGKTLAYLVPAALAGRRVVVSTGTRTLQDQIFYKDIPALGRALGRPIRAAYMKGRTNFLCLHRFERLHEARAGLPASERRWLERFAEWIPTTSTGDRAEVEELPDGEPLWSEVTATSDQCLGRDCPRYTDCFITRMRERADEAEVVIVNHHLLAADAAVRQGKFGEVIPECDLAVLDEAHQLEDVVTQYFGISLSSSRVDEFARDASRAAGAVGETAAAIGVAVATTVSDIQASARQFFDVLRQTVAREAGDRTTLTAELARPLAPSGEAFGATLSQAVKRLGGWGEAYADLAALAARADAMKDDLAVLIAADDPRYVHFVERRGRSVSLRAAPIDASSIIRDAVLGARHAVVLTSATLTVDRSFDYALGRLGVPDASTIRVASEFDYGQQALLYLPGDMPDPRSADFNEAAAARIADLLRCSSGRAFVLFTSYAALRDVHERVSLRIPWPTLVQGTASRSTLLRDFRSTPHSVLFATSSFWQGVDVAGDALSCVIIDRLPFASPGDPIVAARIAAIAGGGGQPFHDYQVPLATLTLLQGLGRLIRTRSDRGVLAVLDPRLTRMSYGRRFLASMPKAPITTDLSQVEEFFGCKLSE